MKEPKPLYAYCTSSSCAGTKSYKEIKNIKRSMTWCPSCGHALFWSPIPETTYTPPAKIETAVAGVLM